MNEAARQTAGTDSHAVSFLSTEQLDRRFGNVHFYRSECPRVEASIGSATTKVLLDSGAEVNVIKEKVAHKAGLPILSLPSGMRNERLKAANGILEPFIGLVETVIRIGPSRPQC